MAGRRRRATSTSTVATVDEDTITYSRETRVLKPLPPHIIGDYDEWPSFLLTEAIVYNRHGQLANLLHVDLEGPLLVRGLMIVEPEFGEHVLRGFTRASSIWIEIPRVYNYSIGLNPQLVPVIWATGQCAHFEIVPSESYAPICKSMLQGVKLWYAVVDTYESEYLDLVTQEEIKPARKRRKLRREDVNISREDLLFRIAVAVGDGATLEEIEQRCKDYAPFLLAQSLRHEGTDSSIHKTSFIVWLKGESPDVVQKLGKKGAPDTDVVFAGLEPLQRNSSSARLKSASEARDIIEHSSDDQRSSRGRSVRRQRESATTKQEVPATKNVDAHDFGQQSARHISSPKQSGAVLQVSGPPTSESALNALIDVLNETRTAMLLAMSVGGGHKRHPDLTTASSWETKIYMAMSISPYPAKSEILLYHARGLADQLGPEWHDSELYKWAKANANRKPTFEHISEEGILKLGRRQKMPNMANRTKATAESRGSSAHTNTIGKRPPRGRPSGKAAGLRPILGSKKRPRESDGDRDDDAMDIDDEGVPQRKTSKVSGYLSDGEDDEEREDDESSSQDEDGSPTRIVMDAEPLPSTQPKGPDRTWTCEELDCDYVVRNADDEEGQELIRLHYEGHDKEASVEAKERELNKINLAKQESRGHLPIDHLLDKIREASAKTQERNQAEINGRIVPQPIKRSLLI